MIQIYVFILSSTEQAITSETKQILLILWIYNKEDYIGQSLKK